MLFIYIPHVLDISVAFSLCLACHGLRRRSSAARLLRLRVRVQPVSWCLSLVSDVCCQKSLWGTDPSSRGVLPNLKPSCVWFRNLMNEEALSCVGPLHPRTKKTARNYLKHKSKSLWTLLTFWRRNFFLILAHPVYKMWIIQEPNTLELWNKLHFEEKETESIYRV